MDIFDGKPDTQQRDGRVSAQGAYFGEVAGGTLRTRLKVVGLAVVFLWFLVGGIAHFAATQTEMLIMPPYVPWPRAMVLVSGVFELLGAFGLLAARTRRAAGIGLLLLTIAVTPANVYMLQRADLFPAIPLWVLWARLPAQIGLLALIWWSTKPEKGAKPG